MPPETPSWRVLPSLYPPPALLPDRECTMASVSACRQGALQWGFPDPLT